MSYVYKIAIPLAVSEASTRKKLEKPKFLHTFSTFSLSIFVSIRKRHEGLCFFTRFSKKLTVSELHIPLQFLDIKLGKKWGMYQPATSAD